MSKITDIKELQEIAKRLPEYREPYYIYDPEYYTDKSLKFIIAEEIREKALNMLRQEVPHGIAVEIIRFDEQDDIVYIDADIVCEQDRHKGMIIGKGGMGQKTTNACIKEKAVHCVFPGGCAVVGATEVEEVVSAEWLDLGMPEAFYTLKVKEFGPLIVSIDTLGNNLYENNKEIFNQRKTLIK